MMPGQHVTFCVRFDDQADAISTVITGHVITCANGCYEVLAWLPNQTLPFCADCCSAMTAPEFISLFIAACLGSASRTK